MLAGSALKQQPNKSEAEVSQLMAYATPKRSCASRTCARAPSRSELRSSARGLAAFPLLTSLSLDISLLTYLFVDISFSWHLFLLTTLAFDCSGSTVSSRRTFYPSVCYFPFQREWNRGRVPRSWTWLGFCFGLESQVVPEGCGHVSSGSCSLTRFLPGDLVLSVLPGMYSVWWQPCNAEVHVVAKSSEHLVFDTRVGFHLVTRSYFQVLYIPSEQTQEISSQVALREIKVKCMHSRLRLPGGMRLPSKAASLSERYNSSDKQVYKCAILISIQASDPLAHSNHTRCCIRRMYSRQLQTL